MSELKTSWIGIVVNNQETLDRRIEMFRNKKSRKCVLVNLSEMNGPIDISEHFDNIDEVMLIGQTYKETVQYWAGRVYFQCKDNNIGFFVKSPFNIE
jgi:protein gp37